MEQSVMTAACDILDAWARDMTPDGIALDRVETIVTTAAFNYYISKYGVPTTANAARHMFEWAAAVETVYGTLYSMEHVGE